MFSDATNVLLPFTPEVNVLDFIASCGFSVSSVESETVAHVTSKDACQCATMLAVVFYVLEEVLSTG